MSHYRPYPSYKDSRSVFYGKVPDGWDVAQFKHFVEIQNGSDHKHIEQDEGYPVIGSGGCFAFASEYIYDGESVLLGRKGTIDKPLYVKGKFWTVDTMYWSKIRNNTSGRFAYYTAQTIPFGYYTTNTALPSMTKGALNSHLVCRPSLEEQQVIASFLDRETDRIDTLIAKKTRFIDLLKEKRQAVITQAVTKGLDDTVPMKDSGVKWLGMVPAHWNVGRLSDYCQSISTGPFGTALKSADYIDGGVPVLNPSHLENGFCVPDPGVSVSDETSRRLVFWQLNCGDVITARRGELGRAALITMKEEGWLCGTGSLRLRPTGRIKAELIIQILQSKYARSWLEIESVGSTMPNLSEGLIGRLPMVIPPSIDEQTKLVEKLEQIIHRLDLLHIKTERSIELLKEHRAALITAAVTGKIDVRETA